MGDDRGLAPRLLGLGLRGLEFFRVRIPGERPGYGFGRYEYSKRSLPRCLPVTWPVCMPMRFFAGRRLVWWRSIDRRRLSSWAQRLARRRPCAFG